MASVNQILKGTANLADDLARYLKACGKSSVLQTKPVNPSQLKGLSFTPKAIGDSIIVNKKAGTILNTQTGLQEPIIFNNLLNKATFKPNAKNYIIAYNQWGEIIGKAQFKCVKSCLDEIPELHIQYFGTCNKYKGIGSEIVRKLAQLSQELGYGGRVSLEAVTGSVPFDFRLIGYAEKSKMSAALKYYKMGFSSCSKEINEQIKNVIATDGNGFSNNKDLFSGLDMYLTRESINRFLNNL